MNHIPQTTQYVCPCCKGFIGEAAPIDQVIDAEQSRVSKRILSALSNPVGSRVSIAAITRYIWLNKQPSNPEAVFRVTMVALRKRLDSYGWAIICDRSRGIDEHGGSFYRLIPAEVTP